MAEAHLRPLRPSTAALLRESRQNIIAALGLSAEEAGIEAQLLLRHALGGVTRAWLMTHAEQALTSAEDARFQTLLKRRLQGEPIAYIVGKREFYGLEFDVTPAVLIPRPDTETLVEAALQRIPPECPCRVLDLGAGSGAVAIAIAAQRPQALVTAVDRSESALAVAQGNAQRLSPGNMRLQCSDWFSALEAERFDVIVSNPPYIAAGDPHLSRGDLRFEPASALAAGADGLDDIRRIVAEATAHLADGGWLMLEHGYDQAARVAKLFHQAGLLEVGQVADLAGVLRVTVGRTRAG